MHSAAPNVECTGEGYISSREKKTSSDLDRWVVMPLTEIAFINNGKGP